MKDFIRRFEDLYKKLKRLGNDQVPPNFMKLDQFIMALHEDTKERIDDKGHDSFEREKELAISKWRKRMRNLGRDMGEYDSAIDGVTQYIHKAYEKTPDVAFLHESSTNEVVDLA